MNKTKSIFTIVLISICTTSVVRAQQTSGDTEKAIAALEAQWTQAQKASDADAVEKLLADDFINTDTDGKTTSKTQELAETKGTKFSSIATTDLHVTVYGTTAVASLIFSGKGTGPNGKPFAEHSRWTDTWVKMPNGSWQCVAAHGTTIKKKV